MKSPPPLVVPKDVAARIAENRKAAAYWERLPPSHKREYLTWVTDAKKDETRARRVEQMIAMLASEKTRG